MTIDDAIEENGVYLSDGVWTDWQKHIKAIKLGIEALKRFKLYRKVIMPPGGELLPGETEE